MQKKIICIFYCLLLVVAIFPEVESLRNNTINSTVPIPSLINIGGDWTQVQRLFASDGVQGDFFGWSVSISGDTALIGTLNDGNNNVSVGGSVYVFTHSNTTWTQQAKLLPQDGAIGYYFGSSVSLDGDTALIGFPDDEHNGEQSGSAYVFTRSGNTWIQQAKLIASDDAAGDEFGTRVSLSGDTALIGAPYDDDYGNNSGSAYVFTRTGTTWTQQAKLLAPDGFWIDNFGFSVSLSGDTALIGSINDEAYRGSAYVFTRTGTIWNLQAKLFDSNENYGQFGFSTSLDGDTALIGERQNTNVSQSSVYVFIRTGTKWSQQTKITVSDVSGGYPLGWSESIDGNTALLGADLTSFDGAAYIFTHVGTTWPRQAKLTASDGATWDYFGCSVSLSGNTALIGAYGDNNETGSVYVFTREGGNQPPVFGIPTPGNKSKNNPLSFTWNIPIEDPESDVFSWTIQCSNGQISSGTNALNGTKSLVLSDLEYSTVYTVWVNATDPTSSGKYTRSKYTFTTQQQNVPPNKPNEPSGAASGKTNIVYTYTTSTIDPNDDQVYYLWDWGDGNNSGWLGPYNSGATIRTPYTWAVKGSYSIKVRAKDVNGYESDWSDSLPITMPYTYKPMQQFFELLFERFFNAFPILRQLMG